jgi:hypothetical protein
VTRATGACRGGHRSAVRARGRPCADCIAARNRGKGPLASGVYPDRWSGGTITRWNEAARDSPPSRRKRFGEVSPQPWRRRKRVGESEGRSPSGQVGTGANERQRVSHANGARRRSGARESVLGSPRGEAPRLMSRY